MLHGAVPHPVLFREVLGPGARAVRTLAAAAAVGDLAQQLPGLNIAPIAIGYSYSLI